MNTVSRSCAFFGLLLPTLALLAGAAPVRAEVTPTDHAALQALIDAGVPVVDIRTPEEWSRTGVIEGSHLLTFFDAEGKHDAPAWLSALSDIAASDEPVVIICQRGGRSQVVSRLLDGPAAYERVHDAREGIAGWIAEGGPTVSPEAFGQ